MGRPFTSDWLLARLLTTLGLGSTALGPAAGCAGRPEPRANSTAQSAESSTGQLPPERPPPLDEHSADLAPGAPDPKSCGELRMNWRPTKPPDGCPLAHGRYIPPYMCLPAPPKGRTCAQTYSKQCVLEAYQCWATSDGRGDVACGPVSSPNGACCYALPEACFDIIGRPFVVNGRARLATAGEDPSWVRDLQPCMNLSSSISRGNSGNVHNRKGGRAFAPCTCQQRRDVAIA
jgi:hypothetical protein